MVRRFKQPKYLYVTIFIVVLVGFLALTAVTAFITKYTPNEVQMFTKDKDVEVIRHEGPNGYVVTEMKGLFTKEECASLIKFAKSQGLTESQVWSFDQNSGNVTDKTHRKSKQVWIPPADNEVVKKASDISQFITGLPVSHQEMVQIAMYEKGGMFNAHFDACYGEDKDYCEKMNHSSGERRSTLLIYLNDEFDGGETEFVNIGVKIKPETGKGILFWNTYTDDSVIEESKHCGKPVLNGEKWICTVWSHSNEYKG